MTDTIRERIIKEYLTRAGEIHASSTEETFLTDIGNNVFRATKEIEEDDLPMVIVWPGTEESEKRYGETVCTTSLKFDAGMAFGDENPSVVQERMLGDLIWCVTHSQVSNLIESISYTNGGPAAFPLAEDSVTAVFAEFEIKYCTKIGNPYEQ